MKIFNTHIHVHIKAKREFSYLFPEPLRKIHPKFTQSILGKSNPSYIVQMKFIACIPREIMIVKYQICIVIF